MFSRVAPDVSSRRRQKWWKFFVRTGCRAAAATATAAAAFIPALGYMVSNPRSFSFSLFLFTLRARAHKHTTHTHTQTYAHASLPRLVENGTLAVAHHSRGDGRTDARAERSIHSGALTSRVSGAGHPYESAGSYTRGASTSRA